MKSTFKWLALAIILFFVGRALWNQLRLLDWATLHFRWQPMLAAAGMLATLYAARAVSFRFLLDGYGLRISWRQSAIIAWVPQIAKFVPGQVFAILGAVGMLRTFLVPGAVALAVVLIMDALAVLTGLIAGCPLLLHDSVRKAWPQGWIVGALAIVAGLVCLHPAVFVRLLNALLRRLKRQTVETIPPMHSYIVPVMLGFTQWVLAGAALWLMSRSVVEVPLNRLPIFIPIAALAYTAGYLTPFAPGGLGIREAIFQATLLPILGAPVAVVVIAMRIVQTLVEVGMALLGTALLKAR